MVRVPDWSHQEFEDRSNALARLIRSAWRAVARLVSSQLESKVIVTAADASGIPNAWDLETEAQVLGFVTDTYLDAAGKVRAAVDAPDDFLLTDDLVSAYLRAARNRLRGIGDDVWQDVSAQLLEGVSAGESIPELASRVRAATGVSEARALTIARTEVHAAHEAGSYDQALFVDPDASKIWLATEDSRTRPTHAAAEGQRRKMNEPFEVGGAQLRYPGDPLGPADEVINCRCTTVYDFGTLDSVTSDEPELALVAASKKKWTPSKHPRGNDGKFIKKGAVADLLSKPKPELLTVSSAIEELTEKSWGELTDAQQDYIMDSYGKLPKGSFLEKHATKKLTEIGVLKSEPATSTEQAPAVPKAKVLAQAAPKTNKAAKTILEADDFAQLGNQKYKKPLGKTGKPLRVGFLGDDGSITAHVGLKPGEPTKSSTFLIWGKYPPGTTILESADGTKSVVWNGKKYEFREDGQPTQALGKQAAYDKLHSQDGWVVPKYEGQPVDQPGVLTELVEGYEPDDEVDTDVPDVSVPTPAPQPEPAAASEPEVEAPVVPEPVPAPITVPDVEPQTAAEPDTLPEPDVLQQLMDDVPQASPATHALFKLKSGEGLTPAEAVIAMQGLSQEDWNDLTLNQRAKLALGVDSALDDENINNADAWDTFYKLGELQSKQTAPAPEPSAATAIPTPEMPPAPEVPAAPEPEPTPGAITDEGEWVAIAAYDFFSGGDVVAETTDGEFKLVKGHTANTWLLKDYQDQTVNTFTDADVESAQVQAETPFQEWKATPMPEPPSPFEEGAMPVADFEVDTDEISGNSDWEMLLDDIDPVTVPTVIAQAGNHRLVKNPDFSYTVEWNTDGSWIDVENFTLDSLIDNDQTVDEVVTSWAGGWLKVEPHPAGPEKSEPVPTPAATPTMINAGGLDPEKLNALLAHKFPLGTVIVINKNGDLRLLDNGDGTYSSQYLHDDGYWDVMNSNISEDSVFDSLQSGNWLISSDVLEAVPDAPVGAPEPSPAQAVKAVSWPGGTVWQTTHSMSSTDLNTYAQFNHGTGTVVAQKNVGGVNIRAVATGLGDPAYKQQVESLSTGEWIDGGMPLLSSQDFFDDLKSNSWVLPKPAIAAALGKVDAPAPTVGADTSKIPLTAKKAWKKKLSAAKIAYYSKPEKIWDQIQQIQADYPDPDNPGHSKLTPLQVIKSLDEVYTGKLESPYESKMVKWAATAKGKAYTGNTGGTQISMPNTPAAAQTQAPAVPQMMDHTPESLDKLWNTLGDLDVGSVVATNVGGAQQYRMIVADVNGQKVLRVQYKKPTDADWNNSIVITHKTGFDSVINTEFDNQPWKIAAMQLPAGGVPNATEAPAPLAATPKPVAKTMTSATAVWDKISGMPDDTVLATNFGGLNEYQMVVKTDPVGTKYVQVQRKVKSTPDAPWIDSIDVTNLSAFHHYLNDLLGGNEWQLFDPFGNVPDPVTSAPAGPLPPKKFKATVNGLYAAMPTLKNGTVLANGEYDGKKYALVVGYGLTPSGAMSKKKKVLLKTQTSSGYWATVDSLGTKSKLGSVIHNSKYGWIEAEKTTPIAPPSVSNPVKVSKPAADTSNDFKNTPEDLSSLWDHLNEIGDGVVLANGKPGLLPVILKSKIGSDGSISVIAHTPADSYHFASTKEEFLVKMAQGSGDWKITASKSPLFGSGEIVNLSESLKQEMYDKFKQQNATYLTSPAQSIYSAMSTIASNYGVTLLQMLRVIDDIGAKKVSKPDEHLFEKKIKEWLTTPQGAAVASGKPIPTPPNPQFLESVDPAKIPTFEQSSKLDYNVVGHGKALQLTKASKAANPAGEWTAAQENGLRVYTGGTYYSINDYYRGKLETIEASHEKAAIESQKGMRPSTEPMLLHRGTGWDGVGGASSFADVEKMIGQTWKGNGFMSTSVGGMAAFGGSVIIEVEAPPGTPMAYVMAPPDTATNKAKWSVITQHPSENEMLLGAGLHYKILSITKDPHGGAARVRMRVVPPPEEVEE